MVPQHHTSLSSGPRNRRPEWTGDQRPPAGVVCQPLKTATFGSCYFLIMKLVIGSLIAITLSVFCAAQSAAQDISREQLQTIISLPLNQAVKQREPYKLPLKSAYDRQVAAIGHDCQAENKEGQQPYNVCMGTATGYADNDFAIFYKNLQMLCHDPGELTTLQSAHRAWLSYREKALEAARLGGTGAPGFAAGVYLSLVRDHMRELYEIYGLNISL